MNFLFSLVNFRTEDKNLKNLALNNLVNEDFLIVIKFLLVDGAITITESIPVVDSTNH